MDVGGVAVRTPHELTIQPLTKVPPRSTPNILNALACCGPGRGFGPSIFQRIADSHPPDSDLPPGVHIIPAEYLLVP